MNEPKIKLRENRRKQSVECFADDELVYSSREYKAVAIWIRNKYNLTDAQLAEIYNDYKIDLVGFV